MQRRLAHALLRSHAKSNDGGWAHGSIQWQLQRRPPQRMAVLDGRSARLARVTAAGPPWGWSPQSGMPTRIGIATLGSTGK